MEEEEKEEMNMGREEDRRGRRGEYSIRYNNSNV